MPEFDTKPILAGLNDRQREAVQTTEGPVLVVAGPGSGKTRVLTCRIAWLLASEVARPYQILALTFTNKAAREMRERVEKLLPDGMAKGMWVGTFHAQMVRLLRVEARHLGFTSDFTIYDTGDSERILKQLIEAHDYDPKIIKPRVVQNYISGAKNARLSPDQMEAHAESKQAKVAADLYMPYNAALQAANAFDFDDLLLKPLELFERQPDILQKYQQKWSHVLIDEYQDTNRVQYLLAYALAKEHRNLCVVGDDAQSIYAFRGADIKNILSFEEDFEEARIVRLEQNYRSTKNILRVADSVIAKNANQIKKTLWTQNDHGNPITLIFAAHDRDEAHRAVEIIRRERAQSNLKLQDFAVLYRTNAQSRTFEDALRREGLPYRIVGSLSFYQRKEIRDAIAYLRLLVNPNDIASFQRVVNHPKRGIGLKSQQKIIEYARQPEYDLGTALDEIERVPIPRRAQNALTNFVALIKDHTEGMETGMDLVELAASLFRKSGLIGDLELDETQSGESRLRNIHELLQAIQEYTEEDQSRTLSSYLQSIALMTDADTDKSDADSVTLMTLHASKGLEFEVVFIAGLEERLLPLIRGEQVISPSDLEEERRLFYVGITRAKSRLYLGQAKVRSRYGGHAEYAEPSRFIGEIDPTVLNARATEGTRKHRSWQSKKSFRGPQNRFGDPRHSSYGGQRFRVTSARVSGRPAKNYQPGDPSTFKLGVRVNHREYGSGKVTHVEGRGETTTVTVDFSKFGRKRLRVAFAPMEVIE
ncbi:MAG: AAA family ATPase [Rhodothermaceae bacterium]|nr:UvrD-helicase domain-containing protein [Bacteroidota bacterium]MXW15074.1 AAA family ATPase [Rhodothermaceae bacterium]MDE2646293.1 UvrD-helicase domain-containing protein [Bacteroidota bacterium]MXW32095.1 AAA family ATPase [Rhodothermaceae bacterium]MXX97737.1 AAA family ATPase [Rhodothermaceae bacterium]